MKNLISMTDFVLDNERFKEDSDVCIFKISNYANFLKQPLELYMFVPCDENNIPLKKQTMYYSEEYIGKLKGIEVEVAKLVNRKISDYYFAKKRCLFEGFELNQKDSSKLENIICITINKIQITFFTKVKACFLDNLTNNSTFEIKTIEDLIPYDLTLTETAIKLFK